MGVFGGETVGVFVHVQTTHKHGTCRLHALDQQGIVGGGCVASIDFRASQRHLAGHIEQVFHRIGHTRKRRQGVTPGAALVNGRGLCQGPVGPTAGEGIDTPIGGGDACLAGPERLHSTHASRCDGTRQLPHRHVHGIHS